MLKVAFVAILQESRQRFHRRIVFTGPDAKGVHIVPVSTIYIRALAKLPAR